MSGHRFACVLVIAAAITRPTAADAHIRTGIVATGYRASLAPLVGPLRSVASARLYASDRAVALIARSGHTILVLGPSGGTLRRIGAKRVVWHDPRLRGLPPSGDHTPGGIFLDLLAERVSGPHPGFFMTDEEFCAVVTPLLD